MEPGYSLSDIRTAVNGGNGLGGNSLITLLLLFALLSGNGFWGNRGYNDQSGTSAMQQEILYNQHFNNLDNKMDRGFTSIGNGISDATFALNNSIKDGNAMVAGRVVDEGRGLQMQIANQFCETQKNVDALRFDMSNYACDIKQNDNHNTQKILDAISQNKIEALQSRINQLELQSAMCGVVRYPMDMAYCAGRSPFCGCNNGCGCGNI